MEGNNKLYEIIKKNIENTNSVVVFEITNGNGSSTIKHKIEQANFNRLFINDILDFGDKNVEFHNYLAFVRSKEKTRKGFSDVIEDGINILLINNYRKEFIIKTLKDIITDGSVDLRLRTAFQSIDTLIREYDFLSTSKQDSYEHVFNGLNMIFNNDFSKIMVDKIDKEDRKNLVEMISIVKGYFAEAYVRIVLNNIYYMLNMETPYFFKDVCYSVRRRKKTKQHECDLIMIPRKGTLPYVLEYGVKEGFFEVFNGKNQF